MQAMGKESVSLSEPNEKKAMNKSIMTSVAAAVAALTVTSCSTGTKVQSDTKNGLTESEQIRSDKSNLSNMDFSNDEHEEYLYLNQNEQQLVERNNAFALSLFQKTAGMDSHVVSPLSVTYLMAMLADGADGHTRTEMLKALGWDGVKMEDVDALCRLLMDKSGKLDPSTTIRIANYIALNQKHALRDDYVTAIKQNYKAGVESLDFTSSRTTDIINGWCKKQTDGMIPNIIDQVDASATLYAMNAIFFNGSWTEKFRKAETREEAFRGYTRDVKRVQMMHQNTEFQYAETDSFQAVTLPYGNGSYEMTVLLPKNALSVKDMMSGLTAETLDGLRYQMDNCVVDLKLPRFTTEYQTDLNDIISSLGAPSMFSPMANFSLMSSEQLYVSKMLQKAKIEVSEEGTKAAAVTAAVMMMTSLNPPAPRHVSFHADHPFAYFITQRGSGAVLFIGQYTGN